MHRAIVSIGSNIDKERNLPAAVSLLAATGQVVGVSSVYETRPVGLRQQPNFFNAAVLLQTDQTPEELKKGLLDDIEQRLGRVRQSDRNAPRTIDLDIAWYDDASFDYTGSDGKVRHVPDPDLLRFAHVALPVADLLTFETTHPETNESIRDLSDRLQREAATYEGPSVWRRPEIDLTPLLSPPTTD